jgi:hypothetical protein
MLEVNNVINAFYAHTIEFITQIKLVCGCFADISTATCIAGVSTNVWHRVRIVASSVV